MDRTGLFTQAQKYAQKGQLDKAVRQYEKLLEADPDDVKIHIQIGELNNKLGRRDEALQAYFRAGSLFLQTGFTQKAIAVYKQALNIDPGSSEIHLKLADLYLKSNLVPEAIKHFELVAQNCEEDGNVDDALDIYTQLYTLDPDRKHFLLKQAEMLFRKGDRSKAVQLLQPLEATYKAKGNTDYLISLYEIILKYDPVNEQALTDYTAILIAKEQHARAVEVLEAPISNGAIRAPALHLRLADALERAGRPQDALRQYLTIFEGSAGAEEDLPLYQKLLEAIVRLDPAQTKASQALEQLRGPGEAASEERLPIPDETLLGRTGRAGAGLWRSVERPDAEKWAAQVDMLLKHQLQDLAYQHLMKAIETHPDSELLTRRLAEIDLSSAAPLEEIEVLEEAEEDRTPMPLGPPSGGLRPPTGGFNRPAGGLESAPPVQTAAEAPPSEPAEEPILLDEPADLEEPIILEEAIEPGGHPPSQGMAQPEAAAQDRGTTQQVAAPPGSPAPETYGEFKIYMPEEEASPSQEEPLPESPPDEPSLPEPPAATPDDLYHQGVALCLMGRHGEALDFLNASPPDGTRLLPVRLSCLHALGRHDEAATLLAETAAAGVGDEDTQLHLLYELAEALERCGQADKARRWFARLADLRPDYRDAASRAVTGTVEPEDLPPPEIAEPAPLEPPSLVGVEPPPPEIPTLRPDLAPQAVEAVPESVPEPMPEPTPGPPAAPPKARSNISFI
ncbi:MAG: tetratricopeptide repeat protein [Nitrospirae bacterium]|nr:tetratricopeptide repeat protein [Nitrospirota bacterium]